MAHAPIDIDLPGWEPRPRATLLDTARRLPSDGGIPRWALAGVTWIPWITTDIDTYAVGCDETQTKDFSSFPEIAAQNAFLLADGIKCSDLSVLPEELDRHLDNTLEVFTSAAIAKELMDGTNGGPNYFRSTDTTVINDTARSLRLAFVDMETFLAATLHGAQGVIHLTPGALTLAAADGLVWYMGDHWETASGHLVVADAGYTGDAPSGKTAPGADKVFLYASGPVFIAITPIIQVGNRNQESMDLDRNEFRLISERYALVAFDPNTVGAVRTTLA